MSSAPSGVPRTNKGVDTEEVATHPTVQSQGPSAQGQAVLPHPQEPHPTYRNFRPPMVLPPLYFSSWPAGRPLPAPSCRFWGGPHTQPHLARCYQVPHQKLHEKSHTFHPGRCLKDCRVCRLKNENWLCDFLPQTCLQKRRAPLEQTVFSGLTLEARVPPGFPPKTRGHR